MNLCVIEGPLYEVPGEDGMIVTFTCLVGCQTEDGGNWIHKTAMFVGHEFVNDEDYTGNVLSMSRRNAEEFIKTITTFDQDVWELDSDGCYSSRFPSTQS